MKKYLLPFVCTLALASVQSAQAETRFPDKQVRLIIPFTPGGSNDVLARALAQDLGRRWNQVVVAENRPGAAGNIGAELVARAESDGYTLLIAANNVMSVNPWLSKLSFNPQKDFAPISLLGVVPIVLVVNPSVPAKTVQELVSYAKANPDKLNYASSGTGTPQHLSAELFKSITGIEMAHIPYKGAAPATQDLLAGQVQVLFAPLNSVLPHIQAGKLRALALAGKQASPLLPGVETIAQSFPTYESDVWVGLVAPANTPAAVIEKINADTRAALENPDLAKNLAAQGIQASPSSAEAFRDLIQSDSARWQKVIKDAGISGE